MKISFEFGSSGRHAARKVNEALLEALKASNERLVAERAAHEVTREQLTEALRARVVSGQQMRRALTVVDGGKARYPLGR